MLTEQELKDKCTPEFIKWMCEYAEGFIINGYMLVEYQEEIYDFDSAISKDKIFPLLIHRAVEGWNNKQENSDITILDDCIEYHIIHKKSLHREFISEYDFKNYQPQSLTQAECAMLHCLLDVFKKQEERDE